MLHGTSIVRVPLDIELSYIDLWSVVLTRSSGDPLSLIHTRK